MLLFFSGCFTSGNDPNDIAAFARAMTDDENPQPSTEAKHEEAVFPSGMPVVVKVNSDGRSAACGLQDLNQTVQRGGLCFGMHFHAEPSQGAAGGRPDGNEPAFFEEFSR